MGSIAQHLKENAMTQQNPTSHRGALAGFGLVVAGATLAASTWAAGVKEPGFMFDDRLWREEVAGCGDEWEDEGWFRMTLGDDAVRVTAARPAAREREAAAESIYVHVPGTTLHEGVRLNYLFDRAGLRPTIGQIYEMSMGRTDFSFAVDSSGRGTQYAIEYGGATYTYLLGLPAASTRVHAIVDLDGDRNPDFLVEVGDEFFMLLSSHARPGSNLPSAQLWAAR
jgi:hypothetical protein